MPLLWLCYSYSGTISSSSSSGGWNEVYSSIPFTTTIAVYSSIGYGYGNNSGNSSSGSSSESLPGVLRKTRRRYIDTIDTNIAAIGSTVKFEKNIFDNRC